MKDITITIPGDKVERIIKNAYIKKLIGRWFPDGDEIDWLALQVIDAEHRARKDADSTGTNLDEAR